MKNYYEILEINEYASQELIEHSYKVLAKKYHPDLNSNGNIKLAEQKFKEISEAYYVLSDPNLRSQYNLKIGIGSSVLKQYNNLYEENQKLKQEVDSLKNSAATNSNSGSFFKRKKKKNMFLNSVVNDLPPFKELLKSLGTVLYNETKKPKEERRKDLLIILLTLIIASIIILAFWKIPVLNNILFPKF